MTGDGSAASPAAAVVVAAAGAARRMGAQKLLLPLAGRPVLTRTLQAIQSFSPGAQVVVAVTPGSEPLIRETVLRPYGLEHAVELVPGAEDRQGSVACALESVSRSVPFVIVHDGARPLVRPALFARVFREAAATGGATAAVPARETLHTAGADGLVSGTPPRDALWMAQTPQAFRAEPLRDAHRRASGRSPSATDDAALFVAAGHKVRIVEGDPANLKITFPEDLAMAEAILRERESAGPGATAAMRVGTGWDAHRLVRGRPLVVGGVTLPSDAGLLGHSDADVLAHAVMDAVLGAAALGDIGVHFPPHDPAYEGADSMELLRRVAGLAAGSGWRVENVDATVVAQRPRLAPHFSEMRACLANALGIPPAAVNVKATTSEGMGFTGRGEGICAHAVALLSRA